LDFEKKKKREGIKVVLRKKNHGEKKLCYGDDEFCDEQWFGKIGIGF